jgi:branched-chain amino acid transport system substrate-binding protein
VRLAAAALAALGLGACGAEVEDRGDGPLTIYVSAPLSGPRTADGRDVADGAALALEEAGGRTAGTEIRAKVLDGAGPSGWHPVVVARNARRASEDSSTIAYLGELESGATRVSLPITNEAEIPQVSPGATAVDLTRTTPLEPSAPERYQPSERETFARVIPDDEAAAEAAAGWASELGAARVSASAADDGDFAREMVRIFEAEARRLGLEVGPGAELRFVASEEEGMRLSNAGERAVSSALEASALPPPGRRFASRFRQAYGRDPGPYAAYGFEAMALLLDAIDRGADSDQIRQGVAEALLQTLNRDSILGRYSITADGDTTLDRVAGQRLQGARPVFERTLPVP